MIARLSSPSTRRVVTVAFALYLCCSALGWGQTAPTVYVNPRSGPDDPRIGLKGGLYDAGQAASGLKLVVTTPKPGSFAPDLEAIAAANAAPVPPPAAPGAQHGPGPRGPT